ncbi:MAG: glycoside hydrolase family 76 protein [Propioniciclava sp.]
MPSVADADARAQTAESSVTSRHLRPVPWWPAGRLGAITWPTPARHRWFLDLNYWWQAHLMDCLLDAEKRRPAPRRRRVLSCFPRALWAANRATVVNEYFDDMAWLALALGRARVELGGGHPRWERRLIGILHDRWHDDDGGGGIPWRRGDVFRNVPANGAAALALARAGLTERAAATVDWIYCHLHDPGTGLILEGRRPDGRDERIFSYNQGLVIGALLELVDIDDNRRRLHALVAAVDRHLAGAGVLRGCGGGDGGLFAAITARYLAEVARRLGGRSEADRATAATAARIVLASAEAAWVNRVEREGAVWFGPDWRSAAVVPGADGRASSSGMQSSSPPERDLSVQLGGWMVLELAAQLLRAGPASGSR